MTTKVVMQNNLSRVPSPGNEKSPAKLSFKRAGEEVRTLDVHLGKLLGVRISVGEMSKDAGLLSQGVSGRPAPSRSSGYGIRTREQLKARWRRACRWCR